MCGYHYRDMRTSIHVIHHLYLSLSRVWLYSGIQNMRICSSEKPKNKRLPSETLSHKICTSPPQIHVYPTWTFTLSFFPVSLSLLLPGFDHIAVGNERSANEGNTIYEGLYVNHQYDKGFEFESDTHTYIRRYVSKEVYYFSALQHMWEVQITREFVR